MKKFSLLLLLAALTTGAMAQEKKEYTNISKSISDDGKKLDIKISFKARGEKTQHYENSFDISKLSKTEKEALVNKIMDSLGVPNHTPTAPKAPEPPKAPKQQRFAAVPSANTLYTKHYA